MTTTPKTTPDRTENQSTAPATTRRTVLAGAGVAGVAAVLAACSSGGGSTTAAPAQSNAGDGAGQGSAPSQGAPAAPSQSAAQGGGSDQGGGSGKVLGASTDVPVGGGKVFAAEKVVVTQPTAGDFKCFTAVCTHAGCTVSSVSGGTINCPCHGSRFSIADGSVADGPAPAPLAAERIKVSGGQITLT